MQEWLVRYGFSVELNRRGFRIETPQNGVFNVIVIEDGVKIVKHITLTDVYWWLKQRLKTADIAIPARAKADFQEMSNA